MRTCAATIRQYWNKFLNLNSRSKYTSVFVIAIALVGIFLVPHIAHAELDMTSISNAIILALTRFFLWIASFLIQLSLFFLKFFILLAGYNGFINASVVKFGWNIIRDVANMFFIVILLVIAFGTILGLEQYEWKKSLPKLVFAAIFVNFSNVICQLIIDVSQVFTITFLNAVAGTAGGNFINMMNFREVLAFATTKPDGNADIAGDLLIGALFALFMCFVAAAAIGSYLIVMLFRMVTLWCLIILSPLAFLFSVLPSTQSYAEEFWKEFVNHVIAAPMMVFFLWLSFATFGAGNITESLQGPENNSLSDYKIDDDSSNVGEQTGVSINKAASWMNLANFAVAIGFLMIGMERVQKLGVKGGDWISKAEGFAKNSFQIASGISLARMGYDKAGGITGLVTKPVTGLANVTGLTHGAKMGAEKIKRGWYGTRLGSLNLRREGSLAASQHATHALKERMESEGHRKSSAHHEAARQNVLLANEKRRLQGDSGHAEAEVRLHIFEEENAAFKAETNNLKAAWKADPANAGKNLDEKTEAKLQKQALANLGDKAATLQALNAEAQSKALGGKAAKDIDRNAFAEFDDIQRSLADKIQKAKRLAAMVDAKEDMEDFGGESYERRTKLYKEEFAKMAATRGVAGKEKEYEAAQRKAQTLLTIFAENGELSGMMNEVLKHSDARVSLTSSEAIPAALLAMQTGRDINGLLRYNATTEKAESNKTAIDAEQKRLRDIQGTKADTKQGILGVALNNGAMKKGEYQYYNQLIEGYDDEGRMVRGVYAATAEAGNTPTSSNFASGMGDSGENYQRGIENFLRNSISSINEVKDGRSQIGINSEGYAVATLTPEAEKLLMSISTKSAADISRLPQNLTNLLSTGKYSQSAYDSVNKSITAKAGSEKMLGTLKNILKEMKNRVDEQGIPDTEKSRRQEAMVALMQKITGQTMSYTDAIQIKVGDASGHTTIDLLQ